jgi:hypothetical protein
MPTGLIAESFYFETGIFEFHMSSSVLVDAPAKRVWRVISDAARWSEWADVCTRVWDSLDEQTWKPGHKFGFMLKMAGKSVPFSVTVSRIKTGKLIEWKSTKFTITAVRTISIELDNDQCKVTDSKHFSSYVLPIRFAYPRKVIRRMTESWLSDLKQEAELSE